MKLFQIVLLLTFSVCQCKGQAKIAADSNFISFQGKLKEFKTDSCLINIMRAIVDADVTHLNYPPKLFYYELDFEGTEGTKEIYINPSRWLKSSTVDYKGIIRIGDMSFLCKGNFMDDPLFWETDRYVDVNLRRPKPYRYDSIDVKIEMFARNPSLMGKYTFCKGGPIDLYILVGKKLEGFETIK
jgi:hypothetical protein